MCELAHFWEGKWQRLDQLISEKKKTFSHQLQMMQNINKFISIAQINTKLVCNIQSVSNDWQVTKAYTSQLYMTSGLKWENNNLFWRPPSLKLPARNKLGSLLTEALDESVFFCLSLSISEVFNVSLHPVLISHLFCGPTSPSAPPDHRGGWSQTHCVLSSRTTVERDI